MASLFFATQSPSDFFKHVPKSFIEQIATQIYLPNPVAKREDYISNLGLKEEEFQIIKNLRVNSRQFLVNTKPKQRSANWICTVFRPWMSCPALRPEAATP